MAQLTLELAPSNSHRREDFETAWRTMQVDAMMDQDDNFNGYSVGLPGVDACRTLGASARCD